MTPPTIEQLLKVYRRMGDELARWDRERNEGTKSIHDQMHTIETQLVAQLKEAKDMQGLIAFYNEGRDELDRIDDEYKKRKNHVVLRQEKLEDAMFALLNETNVKSMKTDAGTAFTSQQHSVKVADWRVFFGSCVEAAVNNALPGWNDLDRQELVKRLSEDEAWALIKRAASKDAVKAYIAENQKPVPGVDFSSFLQVNVRRK